MAERTPNQGAKNVRMRDRQMLRSLRTANLMNRADREVSFDIRPGQSDLRQARVPYGVDLAAAWSWRFLVIVAATALVASILLRLSVIMLPVLIALFIAALVAPVVAGLARLMPRGIAALLTVLGVLGVVAFMVTFATQQVVDGSGELAAKVTQGLSEIRDWLKDGPVNASDKQIDDGIAGLQDLVNTGNAELVRRVTEVGTVVGHIVAGFFIVLFASYFFLADGARIWAWIVRLFPRAARERADSSGRVAWASLTQFVRATVLVAAVDALGIALVALVLDLPFVAAIAVLVFLSSFIPLVGATLSGIIAVLVALVDQGPVVALLMAIGVVVVQQLEAHVLQPFLMGKFVAIHPLGIIIAIAVGALVAGIPGALIAVPLVAVVNAVGMHLASGVPAPTDEEFPIGDVSDPLEPDQLEDQPAPEPSS